VPVCRLFRGTIFSVIVPGPAGRRRSDPGKGFDADKSFQSDTPQVGPVCQKHGVAYLRRCSQTAKVLHWGHKYVCGAG